MMSPEAYLPKTDFEQRIFDRGQAAGQALGQAGAVVRLLTMRGVAITDEQQSRILAERDPGTLRRWLERAVTATTCADLFA